MDDPKTGASPKIGSGPSARSQLGLDVPWRTCGAGSGSLSIFSAAGVIAGRFLDGVATGICGVIAVIVTADVVTGTGRSNPAKGLARAALAPFANMMLETRRAATETTA